MSRFDAKSILAILMTNDEGTNAVYTVVLTWQTIFVPWKYNDMTKNTVKTKNE